MKKPIPKRSFGKKVQHIMNVLYKPAQWFLRITISLIVLTLITLISIAFFDPQNTFHFFEKMPAIIVNFLGYFLIFIFFGLPLSLIILISHWEPIRNKPILKKENPFSSKFRNFLALVDKNTWWILLGTIAYILISFIIFITFISWVSDENLRSFLRKVTFFVLTIPPLITLLFCLLITPLCYTKTYREKILEKLGKVTKKIKENSKNGSLYNERAKINFDLQNFEEAILDFNKAVKFSYKNAVLYIYRGIAKEKLGKYKNAISDFGVAMKLDKKNGASYFYRSETKFKIKSFRGALNDLNKAISLGIKNETTYLRRGICKIQIKDKKGAMKDMNKSILINPDFADGYYSRGLLKAFLLKDGSADLEKAAKLGSPKTKIYLDQQKINPYYNKR